MWYQGFPQHKNYNGLPFYVTAAGRHDQPPVYRPQGLLRHQFLYTSQGSGILRIADEEITVAPGCGFYIPAQMPHEYFSQEPCWDVRFIACGGEGVQKLCKELGVKPCVAYPLHATQPLDAIMDEIRRVAAFSPARAFYQASACVNPFIIAFCVQAGILSDDTVFSKDSYAEYWDILEEYMEQNYMKDISLDELSALIDVTPQHLCRIFKRCSGKRPVTYLNDVRLLHVREYLSGSSYTISDIAGRCGFLSPGYMGRLFRSKTGMSPGEYRTAQCSNRTIV